MKNVFVITMLISIMLSGVIYAADRVSLGFIYESTDSIELVDRTNGAINQVSPTCLDLDTNGNLIVTDDLTHEFVAEMKNREILVIPFLSNHWNRTKGRAALSNMDVLSEQIMSTIKEFDLDGINVDIENLTVEDRDSFSEFVRVLKQKMPVGKLLTVSVAANPEGKEKGWQAVYDYEKLGKYADYLFVMTYDEHSQGGACGPVASFDFVKNSIEYALKYVSKDKIVMGIPFYGRFWKDDEEIGGEAVVIGTIPTLISKNKGIVKYDKQIGEACAKLKVDSSKIKTKINGTELKDGEYTVWYPNEESIKAKLNLVNEYDLLGAGVWALGQEKINVWEYYKNELNRIPYESVEEVKKREEYEALVMDLSKLEVPEILSIEIKNNKEFRIQKNIEPKEYRIDKKREDIKKYETKQELISNNVEKSNVMMKYLYENKKQLHISRLCRKSALK